MRQIVHKEFINKKRSKTNTSCEACKDNGDKCNQHPGRYGGSFLCELCQREFSNFKRLARHIHLHFREPKAKSKFQCADCLLSYASLRLLEVHILYKHHGINFQCEKCHKMCTSQESLDRHLCRDKRTHFRCKFCYNTYVRESTFEKHISKMDCSKSARKKWLSDYNPTRCRICQSSFDDDANLSTHCVLNHNCLPHKCPWCSHEDETFELFKQHVHYHIVMKYTCLACDKVYTSQEGYRKHRLKHKNSQYKCTYCSAEFLNERRFNVHVSRCKSKLESGSLIIKEEKTPQFKRSRQTNWESKIIVKNVRNINSSIEDVTVDEVEKIKIDNPVDFDDDDNGWFDDYYKTADDDATFNDVEDVAKEEYNNVDLPNLGQSQSESDDSSSNSDEDTYRPVDFTPKNCRLCDMPFPLEFELIHHFIKAHPGMAPHKCPQCDFEVPLMARLKEHQKSHGIGLGTHHCGNCSKVFRSLNRLNRHFIKCSGDVGNTDPISTCRRCGKVYQTKCGYKRHKAVCKEGKRGKAVTRGAKAAKMDDYIPTEDDVEFKEADFDSVPSEPEPYPDPDPVEETTKEKQPEQEHSQQPIIENNTGQDENNQPPEISHIKLDPPKDSFPCRLCSAKFQYERGIVMHFKAEHPSDKPLICHICGIGLADKLREHLKTHGIGEEFVCGICDKRFNQKFSSKIHELWHQGIEYKCDNCKQKFLNREKRDQHISSNKCKNRMSLKMLPCNVCGKFYKSACGLNSHYITHTPKELRPIKKRMNCETCGKWFESNNGLIRHRRVHTGERPFCCKFCPRTFTQEGNCKVHEKTHTGETKPRKKKVVVEGAATQRPPVILLPPSFQETVNVLMGEF